MKLSAENVMAVFKDCLFKEGENTDNAKIVNCIQNNFGFNPDRLEKHTRDIMDMCNELPDNFMESKGGGWSFLNMCNDNAGNQWADLRVTMEVLVALGMAVNYIDFTISDRTIWEDLPGGVPYIVVKDKIQQRNGNENGKESKTNYDQK